VSTSSDFSTRFPLPSSPPFPSPFPPPSFSLLSSPTFAPRTLSALVCTMYVLLREDGDESAILRPFLETILESHKDNKKQKVALISTDLFNNYLIILILIN
jgi:hypothetical protein